MSPQKRSEGTENNGTCNNIWTLAKDHAYVLTMFCFGISSTISTTVTTQYMYRRIAASHTADLASLENVTGGGPCDKSEVNVSSEEYQIYANISAETSRWSMYMLLTMSIPPLATTLFLGSYSDQVGRRFLFLLPLCATALSGGILCLVTYLDLHLAFLLMGEFIVGCAGGGVSLGIATFAYSSDQHSKPIGAEEMNEDDAHSDQTFVNTSNNAVDETKTMKTPDDRVPDEKIREDHATEKNSSEPSATKMYDKNRSVRILTIECISVAGRALAQMGNGYFIDYAGFFYPALTSTLFVLLTLIFTFFAVNAPEKKADDKASFRKDVLKPLRIVFRAMKQPRTLLAFALCNLAMMLLLFGDAGYSRTMSIYQMSPPFCWSSVEIGWFNSEFTFTLILSIPTLMLLKRFNMSEPTIAGIGVATEVVGMIIYAVINTSNWVFYVVPVLMSPAMMPYALTRSIMSRLAGPSAHGSMFALAMLFEQTMFMIGGLTGSGMYQATVADLHSGIFLYLAGVYTAGALVYFLEGFLERRYPPLQPVEVHVGTPSNTAADISPDLHNDASSGQTIKEKL